MTTQRLLRRSTVNVVLVAIGIVFVAPTLWVVLASINRSASLRVAIPTHVTTYNFDKVLTYDTTYRPMLNGLLLCGGAALVSVVCAVFAAYPLSRYNLRFRKPFLYTILFVTGLPITAVMVPVYGLFVKLNLIDSITGTMLFLATTTLPFAIWLMKNFMDGVPVTLEEAAWTDGATTMQTLRQIVLPLMLPGMVVITMFTFILAWGNFFVPFVLLLSQQKQPAAVSLFTFFDQYGGVLYGQLAAYSVLYSLPVVVLYLVLSRRLGSAFAFTGALKG